ncbi:MAG: hypothetical protein ACTSWE_10215 [Promethearchaeota archaeon]
MIYGCSPILIARYIQKYKSLALYYAYFGFLFVFTQLSALIYSIQITEGILITGGNISYSSLILLTFTIAVFSNDPAILRKSIIIAVIFNFFLFFLYYLLFAILDSPPVLNIFNVAPEIFKTTIDVNLISLIVFIIEIITIFFFLEKMKTHFSRIPILYLLDILAFMGILCLDGLLFPLFMIFLEPGLGTAITGGILSKVILGLGYSPFLLIFLILFKNQVKLYLQEPFQVRYILLPPKKSLIEI